MDHQTTSVVTQAILYSRLGQSLDDHANALKSDAPKFRSKSYNELAESYELPYGKFTEARSNSEWIDALLTDISASNAGLISNPRTGIFLGSTSFNINESEQAYQNDDALLLHRVGYDAALQSVLDKHNCSGPTYTFATACTSSANALLAADKLIAKGKIDHAIVLGVEFFNLTSLFGFNGLGLISQSAMRPFYEQRDGLVLGEACSAIVLTKDVSEDANALKHTYQFLGGANLSDNHSLTAANPDGSSIANVMQNALASAGICADDIQLVKTHGTASLMNDEAEAAGLNRLFDHADMPHTVALKPYIGHTLGACGIAELALLIACLEADFLPSSSQHYTSDLGIELADKAQAFNSDINMLLSYFGFGGNNASLIFKATPQ